ncbi:MAG: hypothetical protein QXQ70_09440, partial [Candidatus Caldarchaeum sp.]
MASAAAGKTPLLIAVVAVLISLLTAGYTASSLQMIQSDASSAAVRQIQPKIDDLQSRLDSLEKLIILYAKAAGIESPQQAEKIIAEREEMQAKIEAARRESGKLVVYGSVDYADIKSTLDA